MPTIGSKQRKKRKERVALASGQAPRTNEWSATSGPTPAKGVSCQYCNQSFSSRNKMFKHLQGGLGGQECMRKAVAEGMPAVLQTERVVLLLGYVGDAYCGIGAQYQGHGWQSDGIHGPLEQVQYHSNPCYRAGLNAPVLSCVAFQHLWEAVAKADGREGAPGKVKSFSRASRMVRTTAVALSTLLPLSLTSAAVHYPPRRIAECMPWAM